MITFFVAAQVVDTERGQTEETQRMVGNQQRQPGRVSILRITFIAT